MSLILASGSPRRRELMALITPNYTVAPSDVDESRITAATPAQLAQALAEAYAWYMAARRTLPPKPPAYSLRPLRKAICLPMRAPRNRMTKPGLTPSRAMLRCGAAALWDVITILWVCPYTVWHRYCARPERCNGSAAAAWLLRRVVRILCAAHPHKHMMGR